MSFLSLLGANRESASAVSKPHPLPEVWTFRRHDTDTIRTKIICITNWVRDFVHIALVSAQEPGLLYRIRSYFLFHSVLYGASFCQCTP